MLLSAAVLVATVVAFAVAERLKLEPSPIRQPFVTAVFSPVCGCPSRRATIRFTLKRGGSVHMAVVDAGNKLVRHLGVSGHFRKGDTLRAVWDGRDDDGDVVADGDYRPRLELGRRTIVMPNRITVDTRPPKLVLKSVSRGVISPDGDGRGDTATVFWSVNEPAQTSLLVDGKRFELRRGHPLAGAFRWNGRLHGRALRPRRYVLSLVATDLAGNQARTGRAVVRIRFVELARHTIRARVRTRFGVRVTSDARTVTWTLAGRRGRARPGLLILRAPAKPGRYVLTVSASGHAASARVLASRRP
jgi:hypothetical protein